MTTRAGIEPALPKEQDFKSCAITTLPPSLDDLGYFEQRFAYIQVVVLEYCRERRIISYLRGN